MVRGSINNTNQEITVLINDGWAAGYCSDGMRAFCERHGFSFIDFAKNGISSSELLQIDDYMIQRVLEIAHGRK